MATIMVKITNDFHNTEATARAQVIGENHLRLSAGQVRRIRGELCGMSDCQCGGHLSQRGRQHYEIVPRLDGGAELYYRGRD